MPRSDSFPTTRVSYLCEFPTLLGGERSLLTFLDHLESSGIEPVVVAPGSGPLAGELARRRIERLDWPAGGRHDVALLGPALRDRGVEVVHGNSLMVADAAVVLGKELAVPAVTHVRDIMTLSRARRQRLAELAAVVAVSDSVALWLRDSAIPRDRVVRIRNAVDVDALEQAARIGRYRRELHLPREVPLIGCIGQIAIRKGQDLFLEAASRIALALPQARFVVAGARYSRKKESREYEAELRARATVPPLAGRVDFLGFRDDIPSLLSDLDVLLVPSRQEPLSRVLLEALALGVPAVATDVGGTRELLDDGQTGLIVPPGDAVALAAAVGRLLTSPELGARLRQSGPRRARDFSPRLQVQAMRALYERIRANG